MNLEAIRANSALATKLEKLLTELVPSSARQRTEKLIDRYTLDNQKAVVEYAAMVREDLLRPGFWKGLKELYSSAKTVGLELANLPYQDDSVPDELENVELDDQVGAALARNVYDQKDSSLLSVFFEVEPLNVDGLTRMCELLQGSGKASDRLLPELLAAIQPPEEVADRAVEAVKNKVITLGLASDEEGDDEDDDSDEDDEA